jgi:hypothetical protein
MNEMLGGKLGVDPILGASLVVILAVCIVYIVSVTTSVVYVVQVCNVSQQYSFGSSTVLQ